MNQKPTSNSFEKILLEKIAAVTLHWLPRGCKGGYMRFCVWVWVCNGDWRGGASSGLN